MSTDWQKRTVREFIKDHPGLASWWLWMCMVFTVATVVFIARGRYGLVVFGAACAIYCWFFIVSTARYGKRSFRVFRFIFRRGYGDYYGRGGRDFGCASVRKCHPESATQP